MVIWATEHKRIYDAWYGMTLRVDWSTLEISWPGPGIVTYPSVAALEDALDSVGAY